MWDHPLTPLSVVQQDLGLPAGTQFSDSRQALGGEAEASGVLAAASQTASLTLAVTLHPSEATLRAKLRPTLPALHALPPETSLTVQCGWEAGHRLRLELHSGACELQGSGELQLDRRLQWRVVAESSCEALQVRVRGESGSGEHRVSRQEPSFVTTAKVREMGRTLEEWSTSSKPWTHSCKHGTDECLPGAHRQPPGQITELWSVLHSGEG